MAAVSIQDFANQLKMPADMLLAQLTKAGVAGKSAGDVITDDEKKTLLTFLQGGAPAPAAAPPAAEEPAPAPSGRATIAIGATTTKKIKQQSRTGAARNIDVQVKKRRTYVQPEELEAQAKAEEEEAARLEAERQEAERIEAEEQVAREKEVQAASEAAAEQAAPEPVVEEVEVAEPEVVEEPEPVVEAAPEPEPAPVPEPAAPVDDRPAIGSRPQRAKEREEDRAERERLRKEREEQERLDRAERERERLLRKTEKKEEPAPAAGGKGKKGKRGGRDQLHVAAGKSGRRQQSKPQRRKPRTVTTSTSGQHGFEMPTAPVIHEVAIGETINVGELAAGMSVKAGEVIKVLMANGIMATINQSIDQDTAILVVEEMGHTAVAAGPDDPEAMLMAVEEEAVEEGEALPRSAVVTVMGHVDHGKTSLLDQIRQAKVADGEAGGITQHIGAYRVTTQGGAELTFIDTPGHAAFSSMRARGSKATDIVILVVAADDGVMPQTIESIAHAREAEVPIVVAVNKIDRENADQDKVKQELATHEVIPEDWGGDTQMIPVSALTGAGIDNLLESVNLQAELLELKAPAEGNASGVVIEARLDKGRGPVATVLVQKGTLKKGDIILAGGESGRVRAMTNEKGEMQDEAGPSIPVEIQGLDGVPTAGDEFLVVADERKAREIAEFRQVRAKETKIARQQAANLENIFENVKNEETADLNIVVKADVQGSIEALSDSLEKLSMDEVKVKVVHGMVGGISESDVNLAMAANAIIVAFNVRADATARKLIEAESVDVRYHNVIYDVVDEIKGAIGGLLKPEIKEEVLGLVEVREVFRVPKLGQIAGSYVLEGAVKRNAKVRVLRDNVVIFDGQVDSLRRFKDDVGEVKAGFECGVGVKNYNDVKAGDQIEVYENIEVRREVT